MKLNLTRKVMRLPVWLWATLFVFVAGGGIAYVANQPQYASWRYGACKAFLEQYVRFPPTVTMREGFETRNSAVLTFTDMNPFGSEQIRVFECFFADTQNGTELTRITMDRKALPAEIVKTFNAQLPILGTQKLDTALPKALPNDLKDLKD